MSAVLMAGGRGPVPERMFVQSGQGFVDRDDTCFSECGEDPAPGTGSACHASTNNCNGTDIVVMADFTNDTLFNQIIQSMDSSSNVCLINNQRDVCFR